MMREATRRQMLADMGIPVWHLRGAQPQGDSAHPAAPERAVAPEPGVAQPAERARARMTQAAADPPAAKPAPAAAHSVESAAARLDSSAAADAPTGSDSTVEADRSAVADGEAEAPWSVLSLSAGGVVMLVSGDSSRRDLRLARDVLSAASGDWRSRPASRRFEWPPDVPGDGAPPSPDAGRRALTAFVDKDVEDHGAAMLLCEGPVSGRLPEVRGCRRIELPRLEDLGRQTGAKRQLWQAIREARR